MRKAENVTALRLGIIWVENNEGRAAWFDFKRDN